MTQRLYGLFECESNGRYTRLYPTIALPKQKAISIWQNSLLAYSMGMVNKPRELRPVKD